MLLSNSFLILSDSFFPSKIKKELESSTKDFSPEKKEFYKKIVKDTYKKWKPLIDEAINEANSELKNN